MNPAPEITLRPADDGEADFLLSVYSSTRAEEMARVPWSEEQKTGFLKMQFTAQSQHYQREYPAAMQEIICVNGSPAGRLYMNRADDCLHILDIAVLPEFRNHGAGTTVLRRIMAEGEKTGKAVTIYVESFNPAQRLFTRLGFHKAGEQGFNWLLRWTLVT